MTSSESTGRPATPATPPLSGGGNDALRRVLLGAAAPIAAAVLALAAGAVFIAAIGQNPLVVYGLMARQTFGTGYGIGQTLFKATPLVFTGLAVAIGFRSGLFNIGVEGQLYLGAFVSALVGATWAELPPIHLVPLTLLAGAATGAAWGAIPGVLKARTGAHEVINTIMLNFIAFALVSYFGHMVFEPATVRTAEIGPGAYLPRLETLWPALRGSPANLSLAIGLGVAIAVGVLMFRTRLGYELRAVGFNPKAAETGGIDVGRTQIAALALSGAVAGLGGCNFVQGYKHFFELGFSAGTGFLGIAVALLGRNHPIGVVIAALFFGALSYGGLAANQLVPKELVEVLQAIVILLAITAQQVFERIARRIGA
jgi:general nucleoside transport system permease protein